MQSHTGEFWIVPWNSIPHFFPGFEASLVPFFPLWTRVLLWLCDLANPGSQHNDTIETIRLMIFKTNTRPWSWMGPQHQVILPPPGVFQISKHPHHDCFSTWKCGRVNKSTAPPTHTHRGLTDWTPENCSIWPSMFQWEADREHPCLYLCALRVNKDVTQSYVKMTWRTKSSEWDTRKWVFFPQVLLVHWTKYAIPLPERDAKCLSETVLFSS